MSSILAHRGSLAEFYLLEMYNRADTKYAWRGPSVLIVCGRGAGGHR